MPVMGRRGRLRRLDRDFLLQRTNDGIVGAIPIEQVLIQAFEFDVMFVHAAVSRLRVVTGTESRRNNGLARRRMIRTAPAYVC